MLYRFRFPTDTPVRTLVTAGTSSVRDAGGAFAKTLRAWPNPVHAGGVLRLEGTGAGGSRAARLYGADGRYVGALTAEGGGAAVRLPAGLAPGVYVLHVGRAVARVVVR